MPINITTNLAIELIAEQFPEYKNLSIKQAEFAINWGKEHGAKIIQLTTNKERPKALRFYEKLGFKATHVGMKLYLEQK